MRNVRVITEKSQVEKKKNESKKEAKDQMKGSSRPLFGNLV